MNVDQHTIEKVFVFSIEFDTKGDNGHQMKRKHQREASLCHTNVVHQRSLKRSTKRN